MHEHRLLDIIHVIGRWRRADSERFRARSRPPPPQEKIALPSINLTHKNAPHPRVGVLCEEKCEGAVVISAWREDEEGAYQVGSFLFGNLGWSDVDEVSFSEEVS